MSSPESSAPQPGHATLRSGAPLRTPGIMLRSIHLGIRTDRRAQPSQLDELPQNVPLRIEKDQPEQPR
ncbi:hypothetical protein [Kibdelosporangium aridum]|uniref:hypothetical protein n=1 Tax=Kibdelosporangium aridum TaxID=2030 RepID=UPI0035E572E3